MMVTKKATRWNRERLERYRKALLAPGATRDEIALEFGYASVISLVACHNARVRAGIDLPALPAARFEERESTPGVNGRPMIEPVRAGPEIVIRKAPASAVPPLRLPENNPFRTAAWWLQEWGYSIAWRRIGATEVPVINDKLSDPARLCEIWREERERRFGRVQPPRGKDGHGLPDFRL